MPSFVWENKHNADMPVVHLAEFDGTLEGLIAWISAELNTVSSLLSDSEYFLKLIAKVLRKIQ